MGFFVFLYLLFVVGYFFRLGMENSVLVCALGKGESGKEVSVLGLGVFLTLYYDDLTNSVFSDWN